MDKNWNYKKKLHNKISNKKINNFYNDLRKKGSFGGKLLGAGNGGFIFFLCSNRNKKIFLNNKKYKNIIFPIEYESRGSIVSQFV